MSDAILYIFLAIMIFLLIVNIFVAISDHYEKDMDILELQIKLENLEEKINDSRLK